MSSINFQRMIQLAEDVFDAKSDPEQLDVDQNVITRLQALHPATVSEQSDVNGPFVWILLIPTSQEIMHDFLDEKISEKLLLERTMPGTSFEAIYLCSAMVLEEYWGKGVAKNLTLTAIDLMRRDHTISYLYVWPFSTAGELAAKRIAELASLPLLKRGRAVE